MDTVGMVNAYLADSQVVTKNKKQVNFDVSVRVSILSQQTPATPTTRNNTSGGDALRFDEIKTRFQRAHEKYDCRKGEQAKDKSYAKRYS